MKLLGGITIAVIMATAVAAGGVFSASAQALPGDALYPVKILAENIQVTLTLDSEARAELEQELQNEHVQDLMQVLQRGESRTIQFTGEITYIGDGIIEVNGIQVEVDSSLIEKSGLQVGDKVTVYGKTTLNGSIQAAQISVGASVVINIPTVDPSQVATFMPTLEAWLTETPLPTLLQTIVPELTHTPLITEHPIITIIPTNWETIIPYITQTPMPTLWQTIYPQLTITLPPTDPPVETPDPEHTPIIPTAWQTYIPTDIDITAIPTDIATYIPRETPTPHPTHEPRITITAIPSEVPTNLPPIISTITALPTGVIP